LTGRTSDVTDGISTRSAVRNIDVRDGTVVSHLLAPDFFDAERHPNILLTSHTVDVDGASVTLDAAHDREDHALG
jgi:polyisoprenoid-binding protein YceI